MGGAVGVKLLMGMITVKFAAMLIGTSGMGLLANFTALQGLVVILAGLGIQSSAVRDIAAAVGLNDTTAIGKKVYALQRICWLTGLTGLVLAVVLSSFISQISFGSVNYQLEIAGLGFAILFANLSGGQMALIQGMRRIGDLARVNIFSALIGTVAAVAFYAVLDVRGIVPALVAVAAIQLGFSWQYARRVPVIKFALGWRQVFAEAGSMVRLGLVFMWSALLATGVTYFTVVLVTQQHGLPAAGIYSAAFALSGVFVGFVLQAMAADYYPRLTAASNDGPAMVRLVNEQTEIGMLLALPGLLATIALAPWVIQLFYTSEFLGAVQLLQWFILGCVGRVISWPLSYVMLALGKGRWFLFTETTFNLLHVALIVLGLYLFGIEGVAIAFFVLYLGYIGATYFVSRHLIGFRWSTACTRLALLALPPIVTTFIAARCLPLWPATVVGCAITVVASVYALRSLALRIGHEHRIFKTLVKVPGVRALCDL
jgi:PST family polysaccharide transporter